MRGERRHPAMAARPAWRLRREVGGVAMLEFALSLPLVLAVGMYGVETANLALTNMRISQIALTLADNAARVGLSNTAQNVVQLREVDVNDALQAARLQGARIGLTTYGRVTVSSLEANSSGNQIIHWQRCIGTKTGAGYDSTYGITATNGKSSGTTYDATAGVNTAGTGSSDNSASHPGSTAIGTTASPVTGMGDDTSSAVTAPPSSGVIFVEVNYAYQPLVSAYLAGGAAKIHYAASYIVRDPRDFTEIYNPVTSPTTPRSTCDKSLA